MTARQRYRSAWRDFRAAMAHIHNQRKFFLAMETIQRRYDQRTWEALWATQAHKEARLAPTMSAHDAHRLIVNEGADRFSREDFERVLKSWYSKHCADLRLIGGGRQ